MAKSKSTKAGKTRSGTSMSSGQPVDLQMTIQKLRTVRCVLIIAAIALESQNADYDIEAVCAIRRSAIDPLDAEIEHLTNSTGCVHPPGH